ncbi:MAG TPA: hypothetical protein VL860_14535, partial [Planctomycetota bacterium]|nr:hypothetical protein [Planctomycetota bacterium]
TWWQNNRKKHVGYGGKFVETRDVTDVYFDLNTVYLEPQVKQFQPALVVFNVGTYTPNLDKLEVRVDANTNWQPQSTSNRVQWWLHPGDNRLEIRTINNLGRRGPITSLQVDGVKHPAEKPALQTASAGS